VIEFVIDEALAAIPRERLAHLPTPLEPAPRLAAACGLESLWIKRDDATGLATGGNKARKLEFLLADARARGADTLLTVGGVQSNHARMTAAAACRLGMTCELFLDGEEPLERQGNLLLDDLFGAAMSFMPDASLHALNDAMAARAAALAAQGRFAYSIPVGGSTGLGALGYVAAARELADQAAERGIDVGAIVVAVGSTGTLAGLALGARLSLPETGLVGVSVSSPAERCRSKGARIAGEAAALLGLDLRLAPADLTVTDAFLGPGYGIPTPEAEEAIRLAARCEGLILDPVYTGKALAGLRALAAEGRGEPCVRPGRTQGSPLPRDRAVVFWHTGGIPALFAFRSVVARLAGRD
jgi:D-cysteine desulfhydrase family pyridoxal phosphate-dependent enzyme